MTFGTQKLVHSEPFLDYLYEFWQLLSALCSADSKVSKFVSVVQKRLGMNKFVRTKSHTGSKFSKTSLGLLCTRGIVVVHLYCGFSMWRQMAPQQTAKFRTAFFGQFFTSLRKDSVANYAWIWTLFSPVCYRTGCALQCAKRFVVFCR